MFESKLKLYEMEEKLCGLGFFRISKSCLVNLKYIKTIRNDVERRIRITLKNGEHVIVSRQYAKGVSSIFALGEKGIPLSTIIQFLALAFMITVFRWIFLLII